jgi:hypothetical protein
MVNEESRMRFILVYWIFAGTLTTGTAEFRTQNACIAAANALRAALTAQNVRHVTGSICVAN